MKTEFGGYLETVLDQRIVPSKQISEEIMQEVANLNKSIREFCPEIVSTKTNKGPLKEGYEMNELIEHRIKVLSNNSEPKLSSNT